VKAKTTNLLPGSIDAWAQACKCIIRQG